ncbi:ubiquitin-conjugating enzyme E2Z [Cordyceps fumosorosea ARSEF 2679]|uniref:Ubiquitin-conjugating enzyme E2 Z n=1 Tax=Cordyceps fumosorosea (strain ARSEF 2679) TaxID=1081104 RepID=A0A167XDT9_CORFA|nr:ubiquitin-conjugating enzyme E2Z [Cordyceps fumosorosea ARSEF 2679]OAA64856.1 ubiquitin-conjugating enzyme E2Z [Cordyceps fumosorosea ARSEF 2679]
MDHSIIRITKELADMQRSSDLSIAVACRDVDVRNVKALIIGPHETPYEFGFFEFAIKIPKSYPSTAPSVQCLTTNGGRCRFNPNIYSNGKVCLSILGTWRGERGEQWSSAQGMESVLLSIQSLMSANPYENEPGYDKANDAEDKQRQKAYVQKIRHETLRISVIQRLEEYLNLKSDGTGNLPPKLSDDSDVDEATVAFEPFKDLFKRRFLWYFESYMAAVRLGKSETKDGTRFQSMPFEHKGSNCMEGSFNYTQLERRLLNVKAALDQELTCWAADGLAAKLSDSTVAVNLGHQFDRMVAHLKRGDVPHSVALENDNPFIWILTYFGRPMTKFDGGIVRIKLHFSPQFPNEQPRVIFQSKIFHHQIAPDGTYCYNPPTSAVADVRTHIEAIVAALEDDEPAYDPRKTVHPEATKLYWSQVPDEKKQYNRRLRRSVQDSMEDFPE